MRAVKLVKQGESPTVVARILGIAPASVHRWRRLARHRGGLRAKPASGRPRRMSDLQLRQLRALLRQGAMAHGWPSQLWTAQRVAILIERHFGVKYHPEHVRKLLKQRLHWTSQKPQKHARERNDQEVERWIAEEWPRVLRQSTRKSWSKTSPPMLPTPTRTNRCGAGPNMEGCPIWPLPMWKNCVVISGTR
jgi:transposase